MSATEPARNPTRYFTLSSTKRLPDPYVIPGYSNMHKPTSIGAKIRYISSQ